MSLKGELLVWNANGWLDRVPEMTQYAVQRGIAVMAIVETHIAKDSKPPHIRGYNCNYTNHNNRSSGVAVYTAERYHTTTLESLSLYSQSGSTSAAIVLTSMILDKLRPASRYGVLSSVYLPPGMPFAVAQEVTGVIRKAISFAATHGYAYILCGDLNTQHPKLGGTRSTGSGVIRAALSMLLYSANERYCPRVPTHVRGRSQSTIDHVLSDEPGTISSLQVVQTDDPTGPQLPAQAHRILLATSPLFDTDGANAAAYADPPHFRIPRNPKHPSFEKFHRELDHLLVEVLSSTAFDTATQAAADEWWTAIVTRVELAATRAFRLQRHLSVQSLCDHSPALTSAINTRKRAVAALYAFKRDYPGMPTPARLKRDKSTADLKRNTEVKSAKVAQWHRKCAAIAARKSSVMFTCNWRAFRQTVGAPPRHSPTAIRDPDLSPSSPILPPSDSLNVFTSFYSRVFTPPTDWAKSYWREFARERVNKHAASISLSNTIPFSSFSRRELDAAVSRIPSSKAPGEDGIPNAVWKFGRNTTKSVILKALNHSVRHGLLPSAWKTVKCVALHKGGDTAAASNYRLIALSSSLMRLFETTVLARLQPLASSGFLFPLQFGFRSEHSTADALLYVHSRIAIPLSKSLHTFAAFLDLVKAFDTVDPDLLLNKLMKLTANDPHLWQWVKAYLANRSFYVSTGSLSSASAPSIAGTPQGGILSPLLFLIFINDLGEHIRAAGCDAVFFADDVCILPRSSDPNIAAAQLQGALNHATQWALQNGLTFNTSLNKSAVMVFHGGPPPKPLPSFTLSGKPLVYHTLYKYLGVWFDCNLRFSHHAELAVKRCSTAIAQIKRTISPQAAIPPATVALLIRAFALPHLTYGAHVYQLSAEALKPIASAIAHALGLALHLPYHSHQDSLLVEFSFPHPRFIIAKALLSHVDRLLSLRNAAAAWWRHSLLHNHGLESSRHFLHVRAFEATELLTGDGQNDVASATEASLRKWTSHRWGSPLKAAFEFTKADPRHPAFYLSLPSPIANTFAKVRFDHFSPWRRFKSKTRPSPSCPLCSAPSATALHLVTVCPSLSALRKGVNLQAALSPSRSDPIDILNRFLIAVMNAVRDR
jgi:hypothetical protein